MKQLIAAVLLALTATSAMAGQTCRFEMDGTWQFWFLQPGGTGYRHCSVTFDRDGATVGGDVCAFDIEILPVLNSAMQDEAYCPMYSGAIAMRHPEVGDFSLRFAVTTNGDTAVGFSQFEGYPEQPLTMVRTD